MAYRRPRLVPSRRGHPAHRQDLVKVTMRRSRSLSRRSRHAERVTHGALFGLENGRLTSLAAMRVLR
jgi:hypothetical protein